MDFEWDENKNGKNKEKHKLDFETAKEVFDDENRIDFPDNRKDYGEKRRVTIGRIFELLHTVVYTFRSGITRLISARRSKRNERELYNSKNKTNESI